MYKRLVLILFTLYSVSLYSQPVPGGYEVDMEVSTADQAKAFLDSIKYLEPSTLWPNVNPDIFLSNLKTFTVAPLSFYEGKTTNFCAYSALTYIPLRYDPLGFSRFMVELYQTGEAEMGKVHFHPSKAIKLEAGLLKYKGALDINPAGQMWFLILADHFKGYLNFFNRHFDKGDENRIWAATNFAKFNRMLRKLFRLKPHPRGSDLLRPWVGNRFDYLQDKMNKGIVFVYLNNRLLHKKKHVVGRLGIPTHYVLLLDIHKVDGDKVDIVYWDYGKKSLQQVTTHFLHKIIYGITYCTQKKK